MNEISKDYEINHEFFSVFTNHPFPHSHERPAFSTLPFPHFPVIIFSVNENAGF